MYTIQGMSNDSGLKKTNLQQLASLKLHKCISTTLVTCIGNDNAHLINYCEVQIEQYLHPSRNHTGKNQSKLDLTGIEKKLVILDNLMAVATHRLINYQ